MPKCPNVQMSKLNFQMPKYQNVQMPKCLNAQMPKCPNV